MDKFTGSCTCEDKTDKCGDSCGGPKKGECNCNEDGLLLLLSTEIVSSRLV